MFAQIEAGQTRAIRITDATRAEHGRTIPLADKPFKMMNANFLSASHSYGLVFAVSLRNRYGPWGQPGA
jgi:hypothetical protein